MLDILVWNQIQCIYMVKVKAHGTFFAAALIMLIHFIKHLNYIQTRQFGVHLDSVESSAIRKHT